MPNLRLVIGLTAAFVDLMGCAGKIRYPNYYVLNVRAPVSAKEPPKSILGPVAVRDFTAPSFLRSGPIAYRPSPEQLEFYNYHRWAEDPRRVVTSAVIRELQVRGVFQSVDRFDGHGSAECLITGTIDHLEEIDEGNNVSIEVSLSARLIDSRTGKVLWQHTSSKTAKVDQRSVPGIVTEMSRDLGDVVQRLVSSMQHHLLTARPTSKIEEN
jgi:ABC-type uncharacterized transport system auxiliary subunit